MKEWKETADRIMEIVAKNESETNNGIMEKEATKKSHDPSNRCKIYPTEYLLLHHHMNPPTALSCSCPIQDSSLSRQ